MRQALFEVVDEHAGPVGGTSAFMNYIAQNLPYPLMAQRMGIEGVVYVQFVVDKEGRLSEVVAVKGIGAGCDEEAVRVIKSYPKWIPAKQ